MQTLIRNSPSGPYADLIAGLTQEGVAVLRAVHYNRNQTAPVAFGPGAPTQDVCPPVNIYINDVDELAHTQLVWRVELIAELTNPGEVALVYLRVATPSIPGGAMAFVPAIYGSDRGTGAPPYDVATGYTLIGNAGTGLGAAPPLEVGANSLHFDLSVGGIGTGAIQGTGYANHSCLRFEGSPTQQITP